MLEEIDITAMQSNMRELLTDEDKDKLRDLLTYAGAGFKVAELDPDWVRRFEEAGLVFRTHEQGTWLWATPFAKAVVG